ncbi:EmrB/QacA subfamily drug resistance transporter [Kineosphaera limosa]|uniref:Putative drug resistance protein n=1 Tax=Kineosphaera limosa NBRC 100340 TaxID=1184609 RepID=K6X9I8_9MICO|nr:MFS transporter [Kineosphaera limosa]NYE01333.1 EmrB/QacA subfamily drug resistance transporter [Kineosphaera limosa]GAB95494.1 putative drug resistance protein [Kineosphaera limosa NBRC 100340]
MSSHTPAAAPLETSAEPQVAGRAATLSLLVVLFASFMDLLDVTIITVAAPDIAATLGASQAQLQWMLAAYVLALGSGLITGGRMGDAFGRRRIFLLSLTGFALASAACALAPSAGMLIALRAVQGLAGGFMVPQVFGIIRSSFAPAAMAAAFGAYGAVQGLASVAGPLLGGALVDADLWGLGWRAIFWINVPVAAVALALGLRFLPESRAPGTTRLDVTGALLAAGGVFLLLLPLVQGRDWGWPLWGWALLALGLLVLVLFLAYERHVARRGGHPVLDPALLAIRPFSAGLVAAVFFFGGLGSFFLVLSLYLQLGTGRTAWETGLVILPYAIGSIITSGAGVALAAKAGRTLLVTGSLTLAASQGLLWWLVRDGATPGYWSLAGVMFLGGLGLGLGAPILVNVVLAGVPARQAGAAGGVLSTVNQIGGAIGIAILATVFFNALPVAPADAAGSQAQVFGRALAHVMPWQVAAYLLAAVAMLALPKTAAPHQG